MPQSHVLLFFPTLAESPGREVEIPLFLIAEASTHLQTTAKMIKH